MNFDNDEYLKYLELDTDEIVKIEHVYGTGDIDDDIWISKYHRCPVCFSLLEETCDEDKNLGISLYCPEGCM